MSDAAVFVHRLGCCESTNVGAGTRIWAFAHVLPGARIGIECNICDHVFIENDVVIGDRVTVKCGVQLWDGIVVEDDVFIGPNATFTNDAFPRSKHHRAGYLRTTLCSGSSIGANATILPGLTVGRNAMVGAGSVVRNTVPPNAIVAGNPAQITGYVDARAPREEVRHSESVMAVAPASTVKDVTLHHLPLVDDLRGSLSVVEFADHFPFPVKRYFVVFDVPSAETRGEHAHLTCHHLLVCVKGRCSIVADDGVNRQEFTLNRPSLALHIPPMVWCIQYKYSSDAVMLAFASEHYDPDDYIRDYDEFLVRRNAGS